MCIKDCEGQRERRCMLKMDANTLLHFCHKVVCKRGRGGVYFWELMIYVFHMVAQPLTCCATGYPVVQWVLLCNWIRFLDFHHIARHSPEQESPAMWNYLTAVKIQSTSALSPPFTRSTLGMVLFSKV